MKHKLLVSFLCFYVVVALAIAVAHFFPPSIPGYDPPYMTTVETDLGPSHEDKFILKLGLIFGFTAPVFAACCIICKNSSKRKIKLDKHSRN